MFGCAWKIKFSVKPFQLIVCFVALTRKLVYTFIFTSNHFRTHQTRKERERERRKKLAHSIHPSHRSTWYTHTNPSIGESHLVHWRDRAMNPPTSSTGEIAPRTHPPIDPPRPPVRSHHEPTNQSTHPVSDPLLDRPTTFESTCLVHRCVAPLNWSLSVPLVLWFWFMFLVLFIYFDSL